MSRAVKTCAKKSKVKVKKIGVLCFTALALSLSAYFFNTKNTISANSAKPAFPAIAESPPQQTPVSRVKITVGETLDATVASLAAINKLVVVSPEIAAAQIKIGNVLTISGLQSGEAILLVSDAEKRMTLVVEVSGKRTIAKRGNNINAQQINSENINISGSYTATFVQNFDGNPSLFRNSVEFRRKLSKDRTLRVSGDLFKEIGDGENNQAFSRLQNFGINQLSIGLDSPGTTIDFLDSQIKVSTLGLNNFPVRGFHLVKTSKTLTNAGTQIKDVEIFAGFARPSLKLYDNDGGKIAGAFLPILNNKSLQINAGFISVSPQKNNRAGQGGTILQMNASYTPDKNFSADGETAYAHGGFSWRARADLKLKQVGASAEIIRFDKNSPLLSIGAQTGGRKSEALAFYWRPENRFNVFASYNHTKITRPLNLQLSDFNRSSFIASAGYRLSGNSRVNLRYLDQRIETAIPGGAAKFQIGTRSINAAHNIRFNRNWANNFEARMNFSREANADAGLEKGFTINEQMRFTRNRLSATGFFSYVYKTPSLTSLIVRNPRLLPPLLQESFVLNPAQFLNVYRDRLGSLLGGIELPQTRSFNAGVRFQTAVSRFTVTGETRYSAGETLSLNQKNLFTSVGFGVRLDAANSIQINGWKSFGAGNQSGMTFSFTHRFGAESGGGFQISKLFGFDKGSVQGRVFYDLNGNGTDDPGEPGIEGKTIQLNENQSVRTDAGGRYQFSANAGEYDVALVSDDLGVHLRASTLTRRKISLRSRQSVNVSFGVSDFGFVGGRVFNDLDLSGIAPPSNVQGIGGVKINLRSGNIVIAKTVTNGNGTYEFQNLRPGIYTLETDAATLPANFRLPAQTSREIKVEPLRGFYLDIPVAAQRAIAGIVFVDKDGDGNFNAQTDEPVEGAVISSKDSVAVSDRNGAYILRNLAAGKVILLIRHPQKLSGSPPVIELNNEPIIKREVNLPLAR